MIEHDPTDPSIRARAARALSPLRLTSAQKREAWQAFLANPEGTEREANKAMSSRSATAPAAVFLSQIRAGEHLVPNGETRQQRITGWRFARGSHGGTYVEDPEGVDPLPAGYDLTTRAPRGGGGEEDGPERLTFREYLDRLSEPKGD